MPPQVNVRWIIERMDEFAGKRAIWRVLLAVLRADGSKVDVFEGVVDGTIVPPRGDSDFGFDPVFQPAGSTATLAESKPDSTNARYLAVSNLVSRKISTTVAPISNWTGKWQEEQCRHYRTRI